MSDIRRVIGVSSIAAELPSFDTEPRRSVYLSPTGGSLLLFVGLPIAGFFIGLLFSFISQWIYLVAVFPLLMGFLAGSAGMMLVRVGQVRGRLVTGMAVVLTSAVTIFGLHFGNFLRVLPAWRQQVPGIQIDAASFFQFMEMRAKEGVIFAKSGWMEDGKKGINLGYAGSYIYWFAEVLLVGCGVFIMLRQTLESWSGIASFRVENSR